MNVKVWVVDQGSYSDYRVVAIFSNEAAARKHADDLNAGRRYGDADVVEWDLLDEAPTRQTMHYFQMTAERGISEWSYDGWSNDIEMPGVELWANGRVLSRARTPEEARKAAYDALAEAAARREGLA